MDLVEVHIIGPQALKRAVDLPQDGILLQAALIEKHLGGDDRLVSGDAQALQSFADHLLASALSIGVGGVNEIDPQVKSVADHGLGLMLVQRLHLRMGFVFGEGHASDADLGNADVGGTEFLVLHVASLFCFSYSHFRRT